MSNDNKTNPDKTSKVPSHHKADVASPNIKQPKKALKNLIRLNILKYKNTY